MARPVNLAQALASFGMGPLLAVTGGYDGSLALLVGLGGLPVWSLLTN
ncbi:hypothetical protein ACFFLM_05830 [Deinococcus oregonensis]|uniref:Uncharacterized protein n=1 Tax=Deinococcus oregonensis TaxID=1805970 RepID=A0ABV6AVF7_9DEIO